MEYFIWDIRTVYRKENKTRQKHAMHDRGELTNLYEQFYVQGMYDASQAGKAQSLSSALVVTKLRREHAIYYHLYKQFASNVSCVLFSLV